MTNLKTYLSSTVLIFLAIALLFVAGNGNSLTGALSTVDLAPDGFEFDSSVDYTFTDAELALTSIPEQLAIITEMNVSIEFAEDVLDEANKLFAQKEYTETMKAVALIKYLAVLTVEQQDQIDLFSLKLTNEENKLLNLTESINHKNLAQTALFEARYNEVTLELKQAQTLFEETLAEESRVNALAELSKKFFEKHWWKLLIGLVLLVSISIPLRKRIKKRLLKKKIKKLEEEAKKFKKMMKELQTICFIKKKISVASFKIKSIKYEERLTEIKHTLPVLKAQLSGKKLAKPKVKGVIEVKR